MLLKRADSRASNGEGAGIAPDPGAVARLERKYTRERAARCEAEALLEAKSWELYAANKALKDLNLSLEQTVALRTQDLEQALSEAERANERIAHQAFHDPLTGLPNRRYLNDRLQELAQSIKSGCCELALLHIDLDRFKQINDTLGHAAGDFVLCHTADVLKGNGHPESFVARVGGDEFVMVVPFRGAPEIVLDHARSVLDRLCAPVSYAGTSLKCGASIGAAVTTDGDMDPGQLLIHADMALYRAKNTGRARLEVFTEKLKEKLAHRKMLADELSAALERSEFLAFYQPRFSCASGGIECVEALARWNHPREGLLWPDRFLPIINDLGLTAQLDDVILSAVLKDLAHWKAMGLTVPPVSVNVSPERLFEPGLLHRLDSLQIPPGSLRFELLESTFLDEADAATLARLDALKARGIGIEIDDFGSGHASIVGVLRTKPSAIKIDRRLIAAIRATSSDGLSSDTRPEIPLGQSECYDLVRSIVDIGRALRVDVIAEGIETDFQTETCTALGCAALQGFHLSEPMPAADLAQQLGTEKGAADQAVRAVTF